jgi:hypothetical protein
MNTDELGSRNPCLLAEGAFAEALACPVDRISELVTTGAVFFVEREGTRLYPSFFADATLDRRQLVAILKLLGDLNNPTKWQFFTSGKGSLGGLTPLEALRQGKLRQVKRTAEGFAQR